MPDPLRDIIARHGLAARKSLGQHFLLDENLCAKIARQAGDLAGRHVVEIGPGPGGLTRALLASDAATITAIEIDPRACAAIAELAEAHPGRLRLIEGDALAMDLAALAPAPRQIIANLPYNVGTPLLVQWLRAAASWERLTLMFQLEVAERICAPPGSSAYGRLGVLAQFCCEADIAMHIPPSAFTPPPAVLSAIVVLRPHAQLPSPALFSAIERVTAAAFGQRRKMLRGALRGIGGETLLQAVGIAGERRAETLSVAEFARLAEAHLASGHTRRYTGGRRNNSMSDARPCHFVWYELMTNDPAAAQAFYTKVAGWTAADAGMPGGDYTLLSAQGAQIAGLMGMPPESMEAGAKPGWRGYISVPDTDAAAKRFADAGATLRFGPMDIPGVGRVASFTDPQGAPILLFTPAPGAERIIPPPGTAGTIGWHELYAADGPSALSSYAEMFGWTAAEAIDMKEHGIYQIFAIDGVGQGGILTRFDASQPPHWVYYINTDSIDAAIARVTGAGGQIVMGPQQVPGGSWILHGTDPTGAMFAMVAQAK